MNPVNSHSCSLLLICWFLSLQVKEIWAENKFQALYYTCSKVLLIHTFLEFNFDAEKYYT